MNCIKLVDRLEQERNLTDNEFITLLACEDSDTLEYLSERGGAVRKKTYGNRVFVRGLIEISSFCKNDCFYCGIRCSNKEAQRYRLSEEEILSCCEQGYALGFRTFVMQGGEDSHYTDDMLCGLIKKIKAKYPNCAVTLSLGERGEASFKRLFDAGADRYLLRHETANQEHYSKLHPKGMSMENRKNCLYALKKIGYQTGCGIMVGSPYQKLENIVEDLRFMQSLKPEMIGIGPFIHHKDTPFGGYADGSVGLTIKLLSILRLMFPSVLLPATTALGTLDEMGREKGILAGANVLMPNLSPVSVRKKYSLYENKICTGEEAAESLNALKKRIEKIGCEIVTDRGDYCYENEGKS